MRFIAILYIAFLLPLVSKSSETRQGSAVLAGINSKPGTGAVEGKSFPLKSAIKQYNSSSPARGKRVVSNFILGFDRPAAPLVRYLSGHSVHFPFFNVPIGLQMLFPKHSFW